MNIFNDFKTLMEGFDYYNGTKSALSNESAIKDFNILLWKMVSSKK